MVNSEYLALASIGRTYSSYIGGICRLWYTPYENLDGFPVIDPTTQMLVAEPPLKVGRNWYGPVNVPNNTIGYDEQHATTAAGHYYKRKLQGVIAGNDTSNHVNLGNMDRHQYCVVGKLRAGGFYIVLGNDQVGMDWDHDNNTGVGPNDAPGSKFTFSDESRFKALILPSFLGDHSIPPPNYTITTQADMEIIAFNPAGDTIIDWTINNRLSRFGSFPEIEIWALDNVTGEYYKATFPVDAVGNPPTQFIVRNAGGDGRIKIM